MKLTFMSTAAIAVFHRYVSGNAVAINIISDEDNDDTFRGEPMTDATINVNQIAVPPGHILVKDDEINRTLNLLDAMVEAGICEPPIEHYEIQFGGNVRRIKPDAQVGYAARLCPLTQAARDAARSAI